MNYVVGFVVFLPYRKSSEKAHELHTLHVCRIVGVRARRIQVIISKIFIYAKIEIKNNLLQLKTNLHVYFYYHLSLHSWQSW